MRTSLPVQLVALAVLLLLLLLLPLLNLLVTLWRRWRGEGPGAARVEPGATPAPATSPRAVTAFRAGPTRGRPTRETSAVLAEGPPGGRRLKLPARLGPHDARRAVVLMAILGPCRALDPERGHPPVAAPRRPPTLPPPAR